ncbi:hypothetical protein [Adonisia turfae]|uniref:hypothetical protein n=1 Tax=Adonisia turfae TaxID=2950184 RepID=UPI002029945F|nr:hypothetical protein [Adonisia turfae]
MDGREGSTLMDWPITENYCRAIAKALDLPIYFSWLEGGLAASVVSLGAQTNGQA